jgi:hypothetical protein
VPGEDRAFQLRAARCRRSRRCPASARQPSGRRACARAGCRAALLDRRWTWPRRAARRASSRRAVSRRRPYVRPQAPHRSLPPVQSRRRVVELAPGVVPARRSSVIAGAVRDLAVLRAAPLPGSAGMSGPVREDGAWGASGRAGVDLDLVRAPRPPWPRRSSRWRDVRPDLVCVFVCGDEPAATADALRRAAPGGCVDHDRCTAGGVIGAGHAVEVTPAVSVWAVCCLARGCVASTSRCCDVGVARRRRPARARGARRDGDRAARRPVQLPGRRLRRAVQRRLPGCRSSAVWRRAAGRRLDPAAARRAGPRPRRGRRGAGRLGRGRGAGQSGLPADRPADDGDRCRRQPDPRVWRDARRSSASRRSSPSCRPRTRRSSPAACTSGSRWTSTPSATSRATSSSAVSSARTASAARSSSGDLVDVGRTVRFQVRDATSAGADLDAALGGFRDRSGLDHVDGPCCSPATVAGARCSPPRPRRRGRPRGLHTDGVAGFFAAGRSGRSRPQPPARVHRVDPRLRAADGPFA